MYSFASRRCMHDLLRFPRRAREREKVVFMGNVGCVLRTLTLNLCPGRTLQHPSI